MRSDWFSNSQTKNFVKDMLVKAGIPLEYKVSSICNKFAEKNTGESIYIEADKLLYCPSFTEDIYREVDQRIIIYNEFPVDDTTVICLLVNVLIECKARKDTELFCFEPDNIKQSKFYFPVYGKPAKSSFFKTTMDTYKNFSDIINSDVQIMQIEKGTTPKKMYEENIIYNAAGSLYDFISFDIAYGEEEQVESNEMIEYLFNEYKSYLDENKYEWSSTLKAWMSKIDIEICKKYNETIFGDGRTFEYVAAHLPVVCMDSPIYKVSFNENKDIKDFEEIKFCATTIRKNGWPGKNEAELLCSTAEVPVIVTNIEGLNDVLIKAYNWHKSIKEKLLSADKTLVTRWPLEAALFKRIYSYYISHNNNRYRSDIYNII